MPADRPLLSVYLITLNEAERLGETLASVRELADEIVVVDSGSTDDTVAIAESFGARVIHNDWPGYGPQKHFAEQQCRGPWLLNLDADEVLSAELQAEIRALFAKGEPPAAVYGIPYVEMAVWQKKPHRFGWGPMELRLYRADAGAFDTSLVHDSLVPKKGVAIARLKGRIYHKSIISFSQVVAKFNRYSDHQVADLEQRGRELYNWRLIADPIAIFFKVWIIRRYFLYGWYGLAFSMLVATGRMLRPAKVIERRAIRAEKGTSGR